MTAQGFPVEPDAALPRSRHRTLADAYASGDNAINALRLALALGVLVAHTGPIIGSGAFSWLTYYGGHFIDAFFLISGYLVLRSRLRSRWYSYLIRRAARIYPGYWVQLIVVAFVLAPVAASLGSGTWAAPAAWDYLMANASLQTPEWSMEGFTLPHVQAWNGSTWTLQYEILAYAACFVVFSIPFARRRLVVVTSTLFVACLLFTITAPTLLDVTTNLYLNAARFAAYFMIGGLAYALRERIVVRIPLVIVAVVLCVGLALVEGGHHAMHIPLAYAFLGAGAVIPLRLGARQDLSFGVYVYGFPVQQMVTVLGLDRWGPYVHLGISAAAVLMVASMSWWLVERPSMVAALGLIERLKSRRVPPAEVAEPDRTTAAAPAPAGSG